MRAGFDTSSLNRFSEDEHRAARTEQMRSARWSPYINSLSVIEILKWDDEDSRDRLLSHVAALRVIADFRLLPLPHEVVAAEFSAWLDGRNEVTLGNEHSASGLQLLLHDPTQRSEEISRAADEYTRDEQRAHAKRLMSLRAYTQRDPQQSVPSTPEEFLDGLLSRSEALANTLNGWFPIELRGHERLTPEDARRCIRELRIVRTYFVALTMAAFEQGVRGRSVRRAPGAIDIYQAAYLPLVDVFLVDDQGMRDRLCHVAELAGLQTQLRPYNGLSAMLRERRHGSS